MNDRAVHVKTKIFENTRAAELITNERGASRLANKLKKMEKNYKTKTTKLKYLIRYI